MVAAAIVGSAVVGATASTVASSKATKAAKKAAQSSNALQQDVYAKNEAALAPYQANAAPANSAVAALLGLPGSDATAQNAAFENFRNSTGYQQQFNEGQRAVTGALSKGGLIDSGAAQKRLQEYGQNRANASFGDYYNRLVGQQQIGLGAASAQAGVGQNFANAVSSNNANLANVQGNAALSNAGNINQILGSGLAALSYKEGLRSSYGGKSG